jgi:tetratricopeptide (TPR) repeat protein
MRIRALLPLLCASLWLFSCNSMQEAHSYEQGERLFRDGDFAAALELAKQETGQSSGLARVQWLLLAAEAAVEQGQQDDALALLEGEEARSPASAQFPEYKVRRRLLEARIALARSNGARAMQLLSEANKEAEAAQRPDLTLEVLLLDGQAEARRGNLDQAERKFLAAEQLAQTHGGKYQLAVIRNGRGMLRLIRSHFDDAIPFFEEANQLYSETKSRHGQAITANNLGICYTQLGDFDRARQLREQALSIAKRSLVRANALGEAGTLAFLQQQTPAAIDYYRQARDLSKELGALPDAARWASNLTAALIAAQNWDAAELALAEALSLKPEPRSKVFLDLNAASILSGRGRYPEARAAFEKILDSHPEQVSARWQAEAGLANAHAAEGNHQEARQHFDAALRIIQESRSDLNRNEHKLTFLARLIRVYQDYVEFLVSQKDIQKALSVAESSRAKLLEERTAQTFSSASASTADWRRRPNVVWLAYWLADKRSFLWIGNNGKLRLVELPPAGEIARLVEDYRGFIEGSLRDPMLTPSESGRKLYDLLIAPAAAELKAKPRAIVIPDGALHQLSFDALPNYSALPAHYWSDEVTIAIAPSLTLQNDFAAAFPLNSPALLIGDPTPASKDFAKLPAAAQELDTIAQKATAPGSLILREDAATPEAWKRAPLAKFGWIHVAAHAEANRQNPLDSAIILARGENYRLYAKDILATPLKADLVTLSACRSSGARVYAGEGQVGLAWAFLGAGARSAVAGLWDVPDASTAQLMTAFYDALSRRTPPPLALQQAKAAVRKAGFTKPYYWAPFQLYLR